MSYVDRPFAFAALTLFKTGYSPIRQRGQQPLDNNWPQYATKQPSLDYIEKYARTPVRYDIGIALGINDVVGIDVDTDDARIWEALRPTGIRIRERGGVFVAKFGSKGGTSFHRWTGGTFTNRSISGRDGKPIVELLGAGRSSTLPPSIHPKTGRSYQWKSKRTLMDTRPDELTELRPEDVRAIEDALAPFQMPKRDPALIRPRLAASELNEMQRQRQERYARTILDRECQNLAAMPPESGRNKRAYDLACRVGKWVHHGILDAGQVVDRIAAACEANGLVRDPGGRRAVLKTINGGLAKAINDALPDLGVMNLGGRC